MTPDLLPASLAARIEVHADGCWIPRKKPNEKGYVWIGFGGRKKYHRAHRLTWRLLVGDIPDGLEVDHLCRVRACCNPAHLELVTHRENTLRGNTVTAINAAKTHCVHGHPFSEENTIRRNDGGRKCRACSDRIQAERRKTT